MPQNQNIKCGLCHYEFEHGALICQGCTGRIVYGATQQEINQGMLVGAVLYGFGSLFAIYWLPDLINSKASFKIPTAFGIGNWGLLIAIALAIWGAVNGGNNTKTGHSGEIRTFK